MRVRRIFIQLDVSPNDHMREAHAYAQATLKAAMLAHQEAIAPLDVEVQFDFNGKRYTIPSSYKPNADYLAVGKGVKDKSSATTPIQT